MAKFEPSIHDMKNMKMLKASWHAREEAEREAEVVKKKQEVAGNRVPMPGDRTCAVRPIPSTTARNCLWLRGLNSIFKRRNPVIS